jgi:hypothetical protein
MILGAKSLRAQKVPTIKRKSEKFSILKLEVLFFREQHEEKTMTSHTLEGTLTGHVTGKGLVSVYELTANQQKQQRNYPMENK